MPANVPDLVLEGHEGVADYALAWSPVAPIIASGGKDRKILLWNIESFLQQKGIMDEDSSNSASSPRQREEEESMSPDSEDENGQQSRNAQGNESEEAKEGKGEMDYSEDLELNSQQSLASRRQKKLETSKSKVKNTIQPRQIKEIGDYLCPAKTVKKTLQPFAKLVGHTSSVEDLIFKPDSAHELCSVGIDKKIIFWDTRVKNNKGEQPQQPKEQEAVGAASLRQQKVTELNPTFKLLNVHKDDINTVDWSTLNPNLIATGSNDLKVCVIDIRKFSNSAGSMDLKSTEASPVVKTFQGHTEPITGLQFCPFDPRYLISSAESVKVWDLEEPNPEEALFFDHIGHINSIKDVQWSKESPWSVLSVSDDMDPTRAGCSLQVFRPLDLLTMP